MQQFDNDLRRKFEDFLGRQGATKMPSFASLDRFFLHEINVQKSYEEHEPLPGHYSQKRSDNSRNQNHQQQPQKVRTYATAEVPPTSTNASSKEGSQKGREPEKKGTIKCVFCDSVKHRALECEDFIKAPDREAFVRKHKGCIFCVKHKYDYKRPCKSRQYLKCDVCGEQHISEMHPNQVERTTPHLTREKQELPM